jgi:hypothetical protein
VYARLAERRDDDVQHTAQRDDNVLAARTRALTITWPRTKWA